MIKIRIDDVDYQVDQLSPRGRALVASLQFVEGQIQRIASEIAVLETARAVYIEDLKVRLGHPESRPVNFGK